MINSDLLRSLIGKDIDIVIKNETESTNTDARDLARSSPTRPVLIVSRHQNGGRGRQGKSFSSPDGGLYMSLLLATNMPISRTIGATSCAAVAVHRAVFSASGAKCGIKWINDIYLSGGKLCGILAESVNDYDTMTSRYLIIGVGVNVNSAPVLNDTNVRAVSLREEGFDVSRELLCSEIVREIMNTYRLGFDFSLYADEYREHSILLGQEITFTRDGVTEHGIAESITDRGALTVRCNDKTVVLDSGEVSVRIQQSIHNINNEVCSQ